MMWQENLIEIKNTLKKVEQFLEDAISLCRRHFFRMCEIKKMLLQVLEKEDEESQSFIQVH